MAPVIAPPEGFVLDEPEQSFEAVKPGGGITAPDGFEIDAGQGLGSEEDILNEQVETERRAKVRNDALDKIIFSSDDPEFDVIQQGEIAQELDTWLEEPEDFRIDETNKVILAETFGLSQNDVNIMDKEMIKKLYGEETKDVAKRLKSNPFEGGYLKKMGESVKRGNKGISMNVAFYEALFNDKGDWQQLMETQDKVELDQLLSPIEGNRVTDLFYSSAQIAPGMVRGFWDAIPEAVYGAAIGATGAVVTGQLGPQALTLADEAETVPILAKKGFEVGLKVGAFEFWYKQGAGQMAHSMLKNDVPVDIAKNIAGIAAIPYALIELSQATKLTPGLRKNASDTVGKSVMGVVKRAVKKYGTTFTQEVWEEVQQEALAIAAEDVAKILAEQGLETIPGAGLFDLGTILDVTGDLGGKITADFLKKRGIRLFDTTKEAAKGMALLPGPGFAIDVNTGVASVISDAKKARINANLPDILSLAPERAELEAAKAGQELVAGAAEKAPEPTPVEITKAEPTIEQPSPAEGVQAKQEGVVEVFRGGTKGQELTVESSSDTAQFGKGIYFGSEGVAEEFAGERPDGVVSKHEINTSNMFNEETATIDTPEGRKVADGLIEAGLDKDFVEQNFGGLGSLEFFANALGRGEKSLFPGGEKIKSVLQKAGFSGATVKFRDGVQHVVYDESAISQPTPQAEAVKEESRIISTEAFEAAKARIKERRGRLTAGVDPGDLVDAVVIGGYFFESGVRKFGTWSADMVKEFGKDITPHLNKIWLDVTGAKEGDDFSDFFDFLEDDLPVAEKAKINKVKPLSEVKKDALQDVLDDEVFQTESEAAEIRKREVDVGVFFVPKKFRGEVRSAIESDPSLAFNVTFKKGEGIPFDVAVQEGFLTREGDATDKSLDISEFLDRVSEAKRSQGKIGGVSQVILSSMQKNNKPPVTQIVATRYEMLVNGEKISKINAEITKIAEGNGLPAEPFLVTTKRGIVGLTRAEARAAGKEASAELRQAQEVGEKVGFKAGERASREKAKVEIQKLKDAQNLTANRRKTAVDLVKAFVPKEDQGKFLKRVSEAKTPRDLEKLTTAVEKGIVRAERRSAVKKLRDIVKTIKPAKMLPEFKKLVEPVLNALKEGSLREETKAKRSELAALAKQVVDQSDPDSIEHVQAAKMLSDLAVKSEKEIVIDDLSIQEIDSLREFLISMNFHNASDTIAAQGENAEIAKKRQQEVIAGTTKPGAASKTATGKAALKVKWLHDNLESMLDAVTGGRVGDYDLWKKGKSAFVKFVYDPINKGVDDQVRHTEEARNIARQVLADNDVSKEDIIEWSARPNQANNIKQAFGFGVKPIEHKIMLEDHAGNPTEFTFTTNELMSIFMHSRSTHNLATLRNQGMNRLDGKEVQEMRGFTSEKIAEIISKLTDQQKNVARQIGDKLMDGFNRDAINETSVQLQGFELANVENYWPAKRSRTRTLKDAANKLAVQLIENMGLLKERTGTGEALRMAGFFETVHDSNNNVAAYIGLAKPLREVKAVYNKTVIDYMKRNGRAHEAEQILDFIQRLEEQAPQTTDLDRMISHLLGNFAKSKLFLNAKIAPRQYLSLGLLKAYVDAKYFGAVRGKMDKALVNEISELSPQLGRARFEGMQYDRDVGDEMAKNDLLFYLTGETSLVDKTAVGIGFFDTLALLDVYRVAKAEVADNNPGVDIKSDEGKALLKDRYEWLARHTQPMWHVKDRSLIGSNKQWQIRALTMFMSAREVIMRMNNNAISEYLNSDKTAADTVRLGKVMGTVASSMALFTMYNLAWAAVLQRKPREIKDFYKNFFKDILTLPFFGEYLEFFVSGTMNSLIEGELSFFERELDSGAIVGTIETAFNATSNLALSANHFITGEKYKSGIHRGEKKWKTEMLVGIDSMVDTIATLGGLPYYGAKSFVKSTAAQITGGDKKTRKSTRRRRR